MANFNDYVKSEEKLSPSNMEMLKKFASSYEGMSEDELIRQIVKEAEKNRRAGKLSNADLDNFSAMISPMLNPSQQKKLVKIIAKLKKI